MSNGQANNLSAHLPPCGTTRSTPLLCRVRDKMDKVFSLISSLPSSLSANEFSVFVPASIGGMRGLNSTLICLMNVSFVLGKDSYVLTMNRGAYPDINDALVTCTEVSGNSADPNAPCTAWTVDPSVTDSTGTRNLARLVFRGKGGNIEDRGRYYMRFHISFRK